MTALSDILNMETPQNTKDTYYYDLWEGCEKLRYGFGEPKYVGTIPIPIPLPTDGNGKTYEPSDNRAWRYAVIALAHEYIKEHRTLDGYEFSTAKAEQYIRDNCTNINGTLLANSLVVEREFNITLRVKVKHEHGDPSVNSANVSLHCYPVEYGADWTPRAIEDVTLSTEVMSDLDGYVEGVAYAALEAFVEASTLTKSTTNLND